MVESTKKWSRYVVFFTFIFPKIWPFEMICHKRISDFLIKKNRLLLDSVENSVKIWTKKKFFLQFQIYLKPIDRTTIVLSNDNVFGCPVYKTSQRCGLSQPDAIAGNFITELKINCDSSNSAEHWILRGCALICDLDTWWELPPKSIGSYLPTNKQNMFARQI